MVAKKTNYLLFFFAVGLVIAVVYLIVRRESDSSFAAVAAWVGRLTEGFDTGATTAIKCPRDMKFFVNARGVSFCCGGVVNPYGATCSDPSKLCAFEPNVVDPRGAAHGFVPVCRS